MPNAVANDALLAPLADKLRTILNAGHVLHLFISDWTPTPGDTAVDYFEAGFDGYAAMTLGGLAGPIILVAVGIYQFDFGTLTFKCTGLGQTVYGWFITDALGVVKWARRFETAVVMTNGSILPIALRPQVLDEGAD